MPALKSPRGFTVIELLVVIAIMAILMSLLFPAVQSALDAAKKAQAKNDVTQIATAMVAFDTEYGRLPSTNSAPKSSISARTPSMLSLRSNDSFESAQDCLPGGSETIGGARAEFRDGIFVDPWANSYYVALDSDYDNQVRRVDHWRRDVGFDDHEEGWCVEQQREQAPAGSLVGLIMRV